MPKFEKTDKQNDFPAMERQILAFWEKTQAFEKLKVALKEGLEVFQSNPTNHSYCEQMPVTSP